MKTLPVGLRVERRFDFDLASVLWLARRSGLGVLDQSAPVLCAGDGDCGGLAEMPMGPGVWRALDIITRPLVWLE